MLHLSCVDFGVLHFGVFVLILLCFAAVIDIVAWCGVGLLVYLRFQPLSVRKVRSSSHWNRVVSGLVLMILWIVGGVEVLVEAKHFFWCP